MTAPIALQLYTVREALTRDFAGTIRQIAQIGYAGVEPAGFPGTTPEVAARLFDELGLAVPSAHTPLPVGDRKNEIIETMQALGCRRIVSAGLGAGHYQTLDDVRRACDTFNTAQAVAADHGMSFGIHNHWWEFEPVDGHYPYRVMLERLAPGIFFEIDTYWVKTAGVDPAVVLHELGARAPLLHIKDGPARKGEPMVAVGDGVMDFEALVKAAGDSVEWMTVELDSCASDMLVAVERSFDFLVSRGLAHGRQG